jgi:hypothetical protein
MTTNPADESNTAAQPEEDLKLHWRPHNSKEFLTDTKLSLCCPATRGIWADALDAMWLSGQSGELTGTAAQLSRQCRCSESEMKDAIIELFETGTADILLPSKSEANQFCLISKGQANGMADLQANLQANGKQILRNRRMHKAHGISQIRSKFGSRGGSKTQANRLAKMKQIHQANREPNSKQSSSKRSVSGSGSGSGYGYNRVQSQSGSDKEELTTSPREEEVLDL